MISKNLLPWKVLIDSLPAAWKSIAIPGKRDKEIAVYRRHLNNVNQGSWLRLSRDFTSNFIVEKVLNKRGARAAQIELHRDAP